MDSFEVKHFRSIGKALNEINYQLTEDGKV